MKDLKLSKTQALFVKAIIETGCGLHKMAELFAIVFPGVGVTGTHKEGSDLRHLAEFVLKENINSQIYKPVLENRLIELPRPISVIDFESTGVDTKEDRICQVGITRINTDCSLQSLSFLVNPGIPIPAGATKIHGITDEMVKDAKNFAQVFPDIISTIEGTDLLTYNGNRFDIPMFVAEVERAGGYWDYTKHNLLDAFGIESALYPRNLGVIFKKYTNRDLDGAHNAEADTNATAEVFINQLIQHPELSLDMAALALYGRGGKPLADISGKFAYNDEGQAVFTIGKHKGKTPLEVAVMEIGLPEDKKYNNWFLSSDMPKDSKLFLSNLLNTTTTK